jgi:hypothetical protein
LEIDENNLEETNKNLDKSVFEASKSFFDDSNINELSEVSSIKSDEAREKNKNDKENVIPNLNVVPKWIIRVNESRRVNWDLFVMTLATWN